MNRHKGLKPVGGTIKCTDLKSKASIQEYLSCFPLDWYMSANARDNIAKRPNRSKIDD